MVIPVAEMIKRWENGQMPLVSSPPPPEETKIAQRVVIGDIDTSWHPLVAQAVAMAHNWATAKRAWLERNQDKPKGYNYGVNGDPAPSMVLVASPYRFTADDVKRAPRDKKGNLFTNDMGEPLVRIGAEDKKRSGYGCGKTHIAQSILWSSYQHLDGNPVCPIGAFFMANEIIQTLGSKTYRDGSTHSPKCANLVKTGEVLVIDDVGTEESIPFTSSDNQERERHVRYFKIINHCYKHGGSVVITANMKLQGLSERIGGRAWSRLMQMAPKGFMLDMTGVPDYRRAKGGR